MSKVPSRPDDFKVIQAYEDAYNPKNREFTFGGRTVKIPVSCTKAHIQDFCASLMPEGREVRIHKDLFDLKNQLLEGWVSPINP